MLYHVAWHVRRHQRIAIGAITLVAALLLAVVVLASSGAGDTIQPLGDVTAFRAEPTAIAAVTSAPPVVRPAAPLSADPGNGPARPNADRGLLVTRLPDEEYQAAALAAIQCTRGATLTHDTTLDTAAAHLWRTTVATPEMELATVAGDRFAYVAAVPVTLAPGLEPVAVPDAACPFAGMDFAMLDLSGLSAVGVAVFADSDLSDGMDDSTVMIVGR